MLVEMKIKELAFDPETKTPIVLLHDQEEKIIVPIWIGILEASAIATVLEGVDIGRPMTHDLLLTVSKELGASVQHVVINEIKDSTFYATIHMIREDKEFTLDARPSDSIALAIRSGASIFVSSEVIADSGISNKDISEESSDEKDLELEDMEPGDFPNKYKM